MNISLRPQLRKEIHNTIFIEMKQKLLYYDTGEIRPHSANAADPDFCFISVNICGMQRLVSAASTGRGIYGKLRQTFVKQRRDQISPGMKP